MIIVKNIGQPKTVKIDGVNVTIVHGISKLNNSDILQRLVKAHPDLTMLDEEPVKTEQKSENEAINADIDVPVKEEPKEESAPVAAGEDAAADSSEEGEKKPGKKKRKKKHEADQ